MFNDFIEVSLKTTKKFSIRMSEHDDELSDYEDIFTTDNEEEEEGDIDNDESLNDLFDKEIDDTIVTDNEEYEDTHGDDEDEDDEEEHEFEDLDEDEKDMAHDNSKILSGQKRKAKKVVRFALKIETDKVNGIQKSNKAAKSNGLDIRELFNNLITYSK
jgi:hypothetical protein